MPPDRTSVLLIDDDPDYAYIMERQLSRMPGVEIDYLHASSPDEGIGLLREREVDVVLLDYRLGRKNGIEVLGEIRRLGDARAVIMITGEGSEDVAARAFREGADDYVAKSEVSPESLQRAMAFAREKCERRWLNSQLEDAAQRLADANRALEILAREDELTGLCTRRYFNERLGQELDRARRYGHPLSVLFIDIDHFKEINDRHGHALGDQVLRGVGQALRAMLRGSDLAARYGGDEFCVLLVENRVEGALIFGQRLLDRIRALELEGEQRVSASIGVATHEPGEDLEALLARADAALYEVKRAGRDGVGADGGPEASAERA